MNESIRKKVLMLKMTKKRHFKNQFKVVESTVTYQISYVIQIMKIDEKLVLKMEKNIGREMH